MRKLILLALVGTLSACVLPPKNALEFRKMCKTEGGYASLTVDAPLETVISRIKTHAAKCNSYGWSTTRTEGMGGNPAPMKYSDRLLTRWENAGTDKPSFVIAKEGAQDINQQKGGFFMSLVDLERKGAQTKVGLYWPNIWGYYDHNKEYRAVVLGQKGPCQYEDVK